LDRLESEKGKKLGVGGGAAVISSSHDAPAGYQAKGSRFGTRVGRGICRVRDPWALGGSSFRLEASRATENLRPRTAHSGCGLGKNSFQARKRAPSHVRGGGARGLGSGAWKSGQVAIIYIEEAGPRWRHGRRRLVGSLCGPWNSSVEGGVGGWHRDQQSNHGVQRTGTAHF
jgi:hypothetical protein